MPSDVSTDARLKLLHIAPRARGLGGVETLMALHAANDEAAGFDANQIGLFDREGSSTRFRAQGFGWATTAMTMRTRMRRACAERAGSVVLWHGWGMPWLVDVDDSERRIACLWGNERQFEAWLPHMGDWFDGLTCMSESAREVVERMLPNWPRERIAVLPVPVESPTALPRRTPERVRPIVIGCAGRLVKTPKRWDRLIPFLDELEKQHVAYRVEIVGDGPMRGWLERKLGGNPAVRFLGWQRADEYWDRVGRWDAAVFFSDYEGGPIVLLETMAAGVVPIYPTMGSSVGDDCVPLVDPRCYYPAGDARAAARAVREVFDGSDESICELRRRAQALTRPHRPAGYHEKISGFVRQVAAWPRISWRAQNDRRSRWSDVVPLGVLARVFPGQIWR